MNGIMCHSCGKRLQRGSLKYILEIRSFADFDGYLEELDGDIEDGINELLDVMEHMDPKGLEDDISMERIYILCKDCSDRFADDPFQTGNAPFEVEELKGTIH